MEDIFNKEYGVLVSVELAKQVADQKKVIDGLEEALKGILSPAIFGGMSDEEIQKDYGMLGFHHVTDARVLIANLKQHTKD